MNGSLDLSEYEAAALEEAKKLDILKMPTPVIDSAMTNTSDMSDRIAKKSRNKGNHIEHLVVCNLIAFLCGINIEQ